MDVAEKIEEIVETKPKEAKVYSFPTVVTGGRGGSSGDWLGGLPARTVFICKPKIYQGQPYNGVDREEYHVVVHTNKCTILHTNLNQELHRLVETAVFSQQYELTEIIVRGDELYESE